MKVAKNEGKQQGGGFSKRIGLFKASIIAINPSKDELIKLLDVAEENQESFKEKDYIGETQDGDTKVTIDIWLKDEVSGFKAPVRFNLIDKERTNKEGTKHQWVNQSGICSWVDEEANLLQWFTKFTDKEKNVIGDKVYRKAHVGEEELYNFIRAWMTGKANFYSQDTDILLDWKKLMGGNIREILDLVGSEYVDSVVALATVRVVDTEEGQKTFQSIWAKDFLPGFAMKQINNSLSTGKWDNKQINRFKESLEGEYGVNDVWSFVALTDYNPEQHFVSSDKVIADDDSSY